MPAHTSAEKRRHRGRLRRQDDGHGPECGARGRVCSAGWRSPLAVLAAVLVPAVLAGSAAAATTRVWSGRRRSTAGGWTQRPRAHRSGSAAPTRRGSRSPSTTGATVELEIRSVRLEGRVIGMAFFSYSTRLDVVLPPGAQTARQFDVDITDLTGQATGKLPATVSLVGPGSHRARPQGLHGRRRRLAVLGVRRVRVDHRGHHRDRARRAADRDLATSAAPQPLAARDQVPAGRGRDRSRAHLHRLGHRSAGAEPGLVAAGGAGLCGYCLPGRLSAPGRCRTRRIRRIGAPGNARPACPSPPSVTERAARRPGSRRRPAGRPQRRRRRRCPTWPDRVGSRSPSTQVPGRRRRRRPGPTRPGR